MASKYNEQTNKIWMHKLIVKNHIIKELVIDFFLIVANIKLT